MFRNRHLRADLFNWRNRALSYPSVSVASATFPMSNSPPEILLQDGVRRHRAGNLQEAEAIYRRILGQKPDHHQALHLVGIIALQRKEVAAAIATIRRAI